MDDEHGQLAKPAPGGAHQGGEAGPLVLSAEALFGGRQELEIHLGTTVYRLRLTRAGKLILTK